MLLAVGMLSATAPTAAAKQGAKQAGGQAGGAAGRVAPGQMKKDVVRAIAAAVQAAAGTGDALAATKKTGAAEASDKPKARRAKHQEAAASPPAAAAASPVVAPAALTAPTPTGSTAAPAAPATAPAASARTRRAAARSTPRSRRSARSAAAAGRSAPRRASAPASERSRRAARPPAAAVRTPERTRGADVRHDAQPAASPLTRTVVRVLEVVPPWLRVALGVLGGLGLLLFAAVAVQTVRRRRLERQRRLLLADVGVLQSALLPQLPERIGGARVTAAYRPAEGLAAGGDFYDAFELPGGRTAVLVGDIAGHGRDVVPLTALVRYNVRAYLEAGLSPRATVHVAANVLVAHLGERQVTLVVAIFDPGTGRLTYACAGHPPPLLPGSSAVPVTVCSSPPIGAGVATGRRQTTIALAPGDVACFHTDGLDEAPLAFGRLGREGLAEELREVGPPCDASDLIARVVRRSVRQPDDMAACVITALPGGAAGWSLRLEELEVDAATLRNGWAQRFLIACGVDGPRIATALREAHWIIASAGTAVIEVRVGEALADVRVAPPPAITLPIQGRAPARLSARDVSAPAVAAGGEGSAGRARQSG